MKKASSQAKPEGKDELRPEYRLDYSKAKPNRFLGRVRPGGVAVVLEPDVAEVFGASGSVNRVLRSIISAVQKGEKQSSHKNRKGS
jgi:hypothetical protein